MMNVVSISRCRSGTGGRMDPSGYESSPSPDRCLRGGRMWREPATWQSWVSLPSSALPGWPRRGRSNRPEKHCKYNIPLLDMECNSIR